VVVTVQIIIHTAGGVTMNSGNRPERQSKEGIIAEGAELRYMGDTTIAQIVQKEKDFLKKITIRR
jgi:hypothetical protein